MKKCTKSIINLKGINLLHIWIINQMKIPIFGLVPIKFESSAMFHWVLDKSGGVSPPDGTVPALFKRIYGKMSYTVQYLKKFHRAEIKKTRKNMTLFYTFQLKCYLNKYYHRISNRWKIIKWFSSCGIHTTKMIKLKWEQREQN